MKLSAGASQDAPALTTENKLVLYRLGGSLANLSVRNELACTALQTYCNVSVHGQVPLGNHLLVSMRRDRIFEDD